MPPATLPKMNDRAKAAFRCSVVVWSAMIAFHVARNPPSATPATLAARTSHWSSVVKAKTSTVGGRTADATKRGAFRPRRSE